MPTALITGVAGQDGIYLAKLLRSRGFRVYGLARSADLNHRVRDLLTGVEVIQGHVNSEADIGTALDLAAPDHVYNLAGQSSVAQSWQTPVANADINGLAVLGLLEAIRRRTKPSRAIRFLQASSAEIFGHPETAPQDERTPIAPASPYGLAKAFAHQAVTLYRESYGLHASNVILFNHESPLRPETFVTRKITRGVAAIHLGRQEQLTLGNLEVSRDWGFAGDYVRAMAAAIGHAAPGDYVVATGQLHSLRELLDVAFARVGITDWAGRIKTDSALIRPLDAHSLVGDASRARAELGWEPQVDFHAMIQAMVDADLAELTSDSPPG